MEAEGFTEASEEVHRVLDLPIDAAHLDELQRRTHGHTEGYRIVSWEDRVPDEHLDGFCSLQRAFNEEAPSGDLDLEPEHWDEERVRRAEERMAKQGRRECVSAAVSPEGDLVALTEMMQVDETPDWGVQGGTLVMPAHRGHRLGLAVKVANQRRFQQRFPRVGVVHSWNAAVNGPMIAINEALGFRPVERLLEMQRKL